MDFIPHALPVQEARQSSGLFTFKEPLMKAHHTKQTAGMKGGSAKQNTRAGSSARPGKAAYPIETTAPKSPQRLRG